MSHVSFYGKSGYTKAKCLEKFQILDDVMKKHIISTSKGHTLLAQSQADL